jgi:hypothetical protein
MEETAKWQLPSSRSPWNHWEKRKGQMAAKRERERDKGERREREGEIGREVKGRKAKEGR